MFQSYLKEAKHAVVLTGAGMSTESGLPDFRSEKGMWKIKDPRKLASTKAMKKNPEEFYDFYKTRIEQMEGIRPNKGHEILAKWEKEGWVKSIITQNVDGFHQASGSKSVAELHGSIRTVRCSKCEKNYNAIHYLKHKNCECGSFLRPNVVLFGEHLPKNEVDKADETMLFCDLLIVLGSSLRVSPANSYVRDAYLNDAKVVIVNMEKTYMDNYTHEKIEGLKISEVLGITDMHLSKGEDV